MKDFEFESCVRKMKKGKTEGLKAVYEDYAGLIYSVVYDMVQNPEDAQDITSDFFIRLWERADSYRFGGKHRAWLCTIARNMAIDFLRKHKREILTDEMPEEGKEDFAEEVVGNLSMQEAMKMLKPAEQEVLDLKIVGEFTFQEIADMLKKPIGTVSWLYRNAILKLQNYHKKEVEV